MDHIPSLIEQQRSYFHSHVTKNVAFRIQQLKKLKSIILKNEQKITEALWLDLHKSYEEAYLTEISIVLSEIDYHLKNLKEWTSAKTVHTPLHLQPSKSRLITESLGLSLIIAPWNYPFQLIINPLIGAISAGCCAVLKPSPYTPNVSRLISTLFKEHFNQEYIAVVEGGREVNTKLLEQRFDFIFFTGSSAMGKVVMLAASNYLTPLVLELGGKSPCIVDQSANIKIAAKRIIWGKLINAGQTCIAPDYLFVHESVKERLIKEMIAFAKEMYGDDFSKSKQYPRIVSEEAFKRLSNLLKEGTIRWGGETDLTTKYIAPTIIDDLSTSSAIMQEEIFGPILPVFTYTNIEEVLNYINKNEKPLALYYFGDEKYAEDVLKKTSSGGVCVNDTLMHIANHHLPFGGVGNSGMGKYHGENSFLSFSHQRAILYTPTWLDLVFKYPPFKYFNLIRKFI